MTTEFFVRGLVQRGVKLTISPTGGLRANGVCSVQEKEQLRERKEEVIALLERSIQKRKVVDWVSMQRLAGSLGCTVSTGEPLGDGILWGISPHGAAVQVGGAIVTFDFDAVSTMP